jgi:hypothetical protein
MAKNEAARLAFLRAINGESYISIAVDFGLSINRIRQLCYEPWEIILEYCFAKNIPIPKGRVMSRWRVNREFWMSHIEQSWNDERSHLAAKNRKGYSVVDTERHELHKQMHDGDGYIDVELYNLVFQSKLCKGDIQLSQHKKDLISHFIEQKRSLNLLPENPTIAQINERDLKVFVLAEKFLVENPVLLEADCSGRALPSHTYARLGNTNNFDMNSQLLVQLKKLNNLREYFEHLCW